MRKKLIIATTAGVLTLGGVAVAVPVLADTDPASVAERIREALTGLVDDGSITSEQADEVAATLSDAGIGGHRGHGVGRLALDAAADALGMTEDELRDALEPEGTSLADVAEAQDVDVDTLIQALVDAQTERIDQAVEDGRLTQAEAEERLADLEDRVTTLVNSDDLPRGGRGGGRHGDDD